MSIRSGIVGYGALTPIPGAVLREGYNPSIPDVETEHPGDDEKDSKRITYITMELFILGALIFIVIFAFFSLLQLLIDVFYETLYPSSVQPGSNPPTQKDFQISIIKQVTYTFLALIILIIYVHNIGYG